MVKHHNKLTTSSLEVIVQILSLCDLNLAMNRLRGRLPLAISNLKNLVILDLHGNSLDHLPKDIGKLLHLRTLDLSDNRFEQLPYEVFGTLCLVRLSVARNLLEGALLPPGITKMPYLEELDVSHNLLTSLRTESLRPVLCPALRGLDFSMNSISTLPVTRDWPHLASLNASDNAIGPRLHVEHIAMCDNLLQADFSGNEIYYVEGRAHGIESMSFLSLDRNPKSRLFKLGFELYETKEAYLRKRTLAELPESLSRTEVALGSFGGAPIPDNAHTAQQGAQRSMRNVSRESEVFPPLTTNMD